MRFARSIGIPFLVDIRDLWPDTFLNSLKGWILPKLGRIALIFDFAKLSLLLRESDGLVAMSNGCLEWGLNKIHKSSSEWDRVFYHGYKRNTGQYCNNNVSHLGEFGKKKIFLFVGTFGNSYELRLIVDAAKLFYKERKKEILFFLAGAGEQYERLRSEIDNLDNVLLSGWISAEDIRNLLTISWVGMVPCRSVRNAAPNKVFEYLSAGLPLISSLEGEMAELINRYRIGLNYQPGDLEGLYECIEILRKDSELRNKMSLNASQFFSEFGDADKIYVEYAEHIERLVKKRREKPRFCQYETTV
jgi:glycosyltransferase involved in cell wall biosynthesis